MMLLQANLPLQGSLHATLKGTAQFLETTRSVPAKDVYLGYPHGPKTSSFIPAGAMAVTRTLAFSPATGATLRLPVTTQSMFWRTGDAPVGSVFGPVASIGADAIYYRDADLLVVAGQGTFRREGKEYVLPLGTGSTVQVKENYVRNHLGYFLWDNRRPVWSKPIAGWCSWMAYLQDVRESDMLAAADFMAKNLKAYGYDIVQMDDGFQRTPQSGDEPLKPGERYSDRWTIPNDKFPHGLASLAGSIKAKGLTPGIWVGLYTPLGLKNAKDYVQDKDGKPFRGPWVNWAMNGFEPGADEAYFDTIRTLKRQGWDYFKIDTLRHVLYDNYRRNPAYWTGRGQSMEEAYRNILANIKRIAGSSYVLACWGALPELAGLPDGCRIGEDVDPTVASMRRSAKYIAQFGHLNNVVWRNDPDYMCLRLDPELARAWCSMTALAGGHLMISDKPDDYTPEHVRVMRQVGPPLVTRSLNAQPLPPDPEFFTLNAAKFGEEWAVVSHQAWANLPAKEVPVSRFGLDPAKSYLAFDFWNARFIGTVTGSVPLHSLEEGKCQVVSLRPLLDHPQVLGTDRHIGQGVHELEAVTWRANTLTGRFLGGPGERWRLFVHVPAGYKVEEVGGGVWKQDGEVVEITFAESEAPLGWSIKFKIK